MFGALGELIVLFFLGAAQPIDVYPIGGQSNAKGKGDATISPSPTPGTVLSYYNGRIVQAIDPVGAANTGSSWPTFGSVYYSITRRPILLVPCAVSGASQSSIADMGAGNWDLTGTLTDNLIAQTDAAMAAAVKLGYAPTLKGILWGAEGETDAMKLADAPGIYTPAMFYMALAGMTSKLRAAFGNPTLKLFIFQIGTMNDPHYEPSFEIIRAQQEAFSLADGNAPIVYRGANTLQARGMMQADGLHYGQSALNEIGATAGAIVASY